MNRGTKTMKRPLFALVLGACAALALPAHAQTPPAPVQEAAQVDSARLEVARKIALAVVPPGSMRQASSQMMEATLNRPGEAAVDTPPYATLAQIAGLSEDDIRALDAKDVDAALAIYDPHWRARNEQPFRAMMDAMGPLFDAMEPDLREVMAHAYARRFTVEQLREILAFYSTPTGALFARGQIELMGDPEVLREMQALGPRFAAEMPALMEKVQQAADAVPAPRAIADLSPADRAALAQHLGVAPDELREPVSDTTP